TQLARIDGYLRRDALEALGFAEYVACKIDDEAPVSPAGRARPGLVGDRQVRPVRRHPAPIGAVGKLVGVPRLQGILRAPIGYDVVVDLGIAGDLDKLHGAIAPATHRRDPDARLSLIAMALVLEGGDIAVSLQQAEASGVLVHEGRDLQCLRVLQWSPDPF